MVHAALFVALICVGAFIAIPIGPVPIVLQNMFVLLAGLILGPAWGTACVAVYLPAARQESEKYSAPQADICWDTCLRSW
jgi:biotin transporter BioY